LRVLFVDTSAWIALYDPADDYAQAAQAFWASLRHEPVEFVTTDYVLDETYTFLKLRVGLQAAIALHDILMASRIVTVVDITPQLREAAWAVFAHYTDKLWSFTDCTSFVLMQQEKLHEAFAFDEHFAQMGFIKLP